MSDLVLASGSYARADMLRNAGYDFDVVPADIDEEGIMQSLIEAQTPLEKISSILAKEKSAHVSARQTGKYIIGSDQVLLMNNEIYSKVKNKEAAVERLSEFQGKAHTLNSAVSVYKNGEEVFSHSEEAHLTMKPLNAEEIGRYCGVAGDVLTGCVGCYALEKEGIRLFEEIKGDYFTILGMPLLPLIGFLEGEGFTL